MAQGQFAVSLEIDRRYTAKLALAPLDTNAIAAEVDHAVQRRRLLGHLEFVHPVMAQHVVEQAVAGDRAPGAERQADDRDRWRDAIERAVPHLVEVTLPEDATDLREWARGTGQDPDLLARLNPAHAAGPLRTAERRILAPAAARSAPDASE